jgi:hypothetical protein
VQSQSGRLKNKFINNKRKYIGVAGHPNAINAYDNQDLQQGFDHYSYRGGQELVIKGGQFPSQRKAKTVMRGTNFHSKPPKYGNAYTS